MAADRSPERSLDGCERILILGRTGSGKTTLARQLATTIHVPHVELDSLYFDADLSTVSLGVLRRRTTEAIAGERWVTDGNKRAVRDLVWPRADTVVWLDYPLVVSIWRLAKRATDRVARLGGRASSSDPPGVGGGQPAAGSGGDGARSSAIGQLRRAAKGVITALRSHAGQRREYPLLFAAPENRHLAVVRLRSPRATKRWLAQVVSAVG